MQTNALSHQDNTTQGKDAILYPHSFLNYDSINPAFIEKLIALESIQDNINYMGEILKEYIAGDYGFNVKITIDSTAVNIALLKGLFHEML